MELIWLRSIPAAFMLAGRCVAFACHWPTPEPASTMICLSPIFSTITVSGIGMNSVVRPALASACLVSSTEAFLMRVGSCGLRQMPSYTAVTSIEPTLYLNTPLAGSSGISAWAGPIKASFLPGRPKAAATAAEARTPRRDMVIIDVLPNSERTRRTRRGMREASDQEGPEAAGFYSGAGRDFSSSQRNRDDRGRGRNEIPDAE